MRRLLMILLSIIIFIGATTSFAAECGDVDGTPPVNILDIVHLINYKYKEGPDPDCRTVTDIDGNVYQTVTIGEQIWMMENLKVTHYRNGDPIPCVTDGGTWSGLTTGAYCNYDNDEHNVATYGRIYNWYAVDDSRNIAPEGWHVPTDEEWKQLEIYLGMSQSVADQLSWRGTDEGGKLKETGTTHWNSPNTGATNESGFSALPGGFRASFGTFYYLGDIADFWSSTESTSSHGFNRALDNDNSDIYRGYEYKYFGVSVRCVKDQIDIKKPDSKASAGEKNIGKVS